MRDYERVIVTFAADGKPDFDLDLFGEDEETATEKCVDHFGADVLYRMASVDPDPDGAYGKDGPTLAELIGVQELADKEMAPVAAIFAYYDNLNSLDHFAEAYRGEHASMADFAEAETDGIIEIPDGLREYVDWEKMGADLCGSDYFEDRGYYFRNL